MTQLDVYAVLAAWDVYVSPADLAEPTSRLQAARIA